MTSVLHFADIDSLATAAADDFIVLARAAIAARGAFHVALSGGSMPPRLYAKLVERRDDVEWDTLEFWWGDERTVPPDHPDSNFGLAVRNLMVPLGIAPDSPRVHRLEGERDPEAAARDYEAVLTRVLGTPPVLDYNLLGMGKDGHTASLHPGSAGVHETARFVIANDVDSPRVGAKGTRLTLTFPALNAARHTRVLVVGADKADALAGVLEGPPGHYPAQQIDGADVRWFVDAAAAAKLRRAP